MNYEQLLAIECAHKYVLDPALKLPKGVEHLRIPFDLTRHVFQCNSNAPIADLVRFFNSSSIIDVTVLGNCSEKFIEQKVISRTIDNDSHYNNIQIRNVITPLQIQILSNVRIKNLDRSVPIASCGRRDIRFLFFLKIESAHLKSMDYTALLAIERAHRFIPKTESAEKCPECIEYTIDGTQRIRNLHRFRSKANMSVADIVRFFKSSPTLDVKMNSSGFSEQVILESGIKYITRSIDVQDPRYDYIEMHYVGRGWFSSIVNVKNLTRGVPIQSCAGKNIMFAFK